MRKGRSGKRKIRFFAKKRSVSVIRRQSLTDSIVTYIGVALGAVNTLLIYPTCLQEAELGLFQFMVSWAMLISPFVLLGAGNLAIRFFPVFRNEARQHNGFLFLMLALVFAGFLFFLLLVWLGKGWFDRLLLREVEEPLIRRYVYHIVPLVLFVSLNVLFINYIFNFLRIAVTSFLENVFLKIATGVLSVMLYFGVTGLPGFVNGIVVVYALVTAGLVFYTWRIGQLHLKPNFSFLRRSLLKEMSVFAYYGILGSASGGLMLYIDKAMLPLLVQQEGLDAGGIYTIVAYIGTAIDIPRKSLEKITGPVIAHSIQEGDWGNVKKLYQKSSINQLIVGCFLLIGIWHCLDDFFSIMPNGEVYRPWKMVVLALGVSSLIDTATGINSQIVTYSQYFRFNFYLALLLGLLNVFFNVLFIRFLGLNIYGAALATFTSVTIFNAVKYWFILWRLNMQPFTRSTLGALLLALVVFGTLAFIPSFGHPLMNIAVKSALVVALYIPPVLYFRFSPDLNDLWTSLVDRAKKRLKI